MCGAHVCKKNRYKVFEIDGKTTNNILHNFVIELYSYSSV